MGREWDSQDANHLTRDVSIAGCSPLPAPEFYFSYRSSSSFTKCPERLGLGGGPVVVGAGGQRFSPGFHACGRSPVKPQHSDKGTCAPCADGPEQGAAGLELLLGVGGFTWRMASLEFSSRAGGAAGRTAEPGLNLEGQCQAPFPFPEVKFLTCFVHLCGLLTCVAQVLASLWRSFLVTCEASHWMHWSPPRALPRTLLPQLDENGLRNISVQQD